MSILKNINYIVEISKIPCAEASALIYIKTAFQSAAPALLTLFQPDCTDIVKLRIGRSPWHLRGISGLIKGAVKPLPLAVNEFLYTIGYDTLEKYLWWWMVADVTSQFFVTWTSLVYQEQRCLLPSLGTAHYRIQPFVYFMQTGFIGWGVVHNVSGITTNGFEIVIEPGVEGSIVYSMTWQAWPPSGLPASNVNTWLENTDTQLIKNFMSTNEPTVGNLWKTGGTISFNNVGSLVRQHYRIGYDSQGPGFMQPVFGDIYVTASGHRDPGVAWGCFPKPATNPFV